MTYDKAHEVFVEFMLGFFDPENLGDWAKDLASSAAAGATAEELGAELAQLIGDAGSLAEDIRERTEIE